MNKSPALFCLVFVLTASLLSAQEMTEARPTEPVLKRVPARAQWSVLYLYDRKQAEELMAGQGGASIQSEKVDAAAARRPVSLNVSKDGNVYNEVVHWSDGKKSEKWISGELQVYEVPQTGQVARSILPTVGYSENFSDYRRSDFEELEWIDKTNFSGVKEVSGRKVFAFGVESAKRRLTPREKEELQDADQRLSEDEIVKRNERLSSGEKAYVAYLDMTTQRPLYFDDGRVVRVYQFIDQPSGRLQVPPRFAEELETWKKEITRKPLPRP